MAGPITDDQLEKLHDAIQTRMDIILTADRRAGILTRKIIERAMHLSGVVYPAVSPFLYPIEGQENVQVMINSTNELAQDLNDWHEALKVLATEYDMVKHSLMSFLESTKQS